MPTPAVEILTPAHLTPADALAIAELSLLVWPSKTGLTPAQRAAEIIASRDAGHHAARRQLWHLVRDPAAPTRLLAKAESFLRTIATPRGPLTILALAGVCTPPDARNRGLGRLVVQSAFARISPDTPFSLFQTTPNRIPFYTRLGAAVATNPVINSLAENPAANPFWDPILFRYPATGPWPEGTLDLQGPGY